MDQLTVIIVKVKWKENAATSQVKRVFFKEKNALAYINENKKKAKYKKAHWIISDRPISDSEEFTLLAKAEQVNG